MQIALLIISSYLLGSIPFGYLIGRLRGVDIRQHGSGNIGFSNVLRTLGFGPAAVVLIGDTLKGYLPVVAGRALLQTWTGMQSDLWLLMLGLAAILGHSFSVFLHFRGGRAIATTGGVLLGMAWPAAALSLGIWLLLVVITRYISVASMAVAAFVPIYMAGICAPLEWVVFWLAISALIILRHLPNLDRLLAGKEAKIGERVEFEPGSETTSHTGQRD